MCGFAGFVTFEPFPDEWGRGVLSRMLGTLRRRGPDAEGMYCDGQRAGVALGHRRLSILDLTPEANQPMAFEHLTIVYNGEVYNFREIRDDLRREGYTFQTTGDTEVLIKAISHWGITGAVRRVNGMFVFAVWDAKEQSLYLVRDRIGIKPACYGWVGNTFVFGSELSALRQFPGFNEDIDINVLSDYLSYSYVPAPQTIFRDAKKLEPATILRINRNQHTHFERFWDLKAVWESASQSHSNGSLPEQMERFKELLNDSIKLRMIADVPLGAFLSGGTDSSLVVSMLQRQASCPVKTFTVAFDDSQFDESHFAMRVADYLGTDHTTVQVCESDLLSVVPTLSESFDEPFADSSQIPTCLVSKVARRDVTVCLSGDGGDELFCGYGRYVQIERAWSKLGLLRPEVRKLLQPAFELALNGARLCCDVGSLLLRGRKSPWSRHIVERIGAVVGAQSYDDAYCALTRNTQNPTTLLAHKPRADTKRLRRDGLHLGRLERLMLRDLEQYLPDDILTKVDRASMAVGLEARVPLLDHRIVEFAVCLPLKSKFDGINQKLLIKRLLGEQLPVSIFDRRKKGFSVPLSTWLRTSLRDWAEDLLSDRCVEDVGVFDPKVVRRVWQDHLTGRRGAHHCLWDILMLQAWRRAA